MVYVGVMVGAGTRDEAPEENGMAHYIEHCVFKGTAHHSARQIIHSIEGIGGEINAYTTKEETTFYAAILAEHVQLTLHLIAEMILQPTFKKEETDKERMVIMDEIESYNDSPSELIYDDFENLVFAGSSLEMPILGTKHTRPDGGFLSGKRQTRENLPTRRKRIRLTSYPTSKHAQHRRSTDGQPTVNRRSKPL